MMLKKIAARTALVLARLAGLAQERGSEPLTAQTENKALKDQLAAVGAELKHARRVIEESKRAECKPAGLLPSGIVRRLSGTKIGAHDPERYRETIRTLEARCRRRRQPAGRGRVALKPAGCQKTVGGKDGSTGMRGVWR